MPSAKITSTRHGASQAASNSNLMTPEQINQAIAEACGWRWVPLEFSAGTEYFLKPPEEVAKYTQEFQNDSIKDTLPEGARVGGIFGLRSGRFPDYCSDLNAMHEAEKVLTDAQARRYRFFLSANSGKRDPKYLTVEAAMCHAEASERAEAFLRTLGLWKG